MTRPGGGGVVARYPPCGQIAVVTPRGGSRWQRTRMNPLRCATLVVADVPAAVARFERWLGYRTREQEPLDATLAGAWDAPANAGRACAVLGPASGKRAFVRLVEGEPVASYRPIRTYGWAAIELCVADVAATHAVLAGSPFAVIGPPKPIAGLPTIRPMQVRGPDAETIYLTEILTDDPAEGLPRADAPIDALFIAVLACADARATAVWFAETLGLACDPPVAIPYSMIARAFDLPAERRHEIVTARGRGAICLEFDTYPEGASARERHPGALPPGVALATLAHPDLDAVRGDWLAPPVRREGAVYAGARAGVLRTPEGVLVEVVEG